jgi:hypothetical protein
MNAQSQIASHLNITASAITRCEEWASVWFVVVTGRGARFVSKKVVTKMSISKVEWAVNGTECRAEYVAEGRQMDEPYFTVYAKTKKSLVDGKVQLDWEFHQHVKATEFEPKIASIPGAVIS